MRIAKTIIPDTLLSEEEWKREFNVSGMYIDKRIVSDSDLEFDNVLQYMRENKLRYSDSVHQEHQTETLLGNLLNIFSNNLKFNFNGQS